MVRFMISIIGEAVTSEWRIRLTWPVGENVNAAVKLFVALSPNVALLRSLLVRKNEDPVKSGKQRPVVEKMAVIESFPQFGVVRHAMEATVHLPQAAQVPWTQEPQAVEKNFLW